MTAGSIVFLKVVVVVVLLAVVVNVVLFEVIIGLLIDLNWPGVGEKEGNFTFSSKYLPPHEISLFFQPKILHIRHAINQMILKVVLLKYISREYDMSLYHKSFETNTLQAI